MSPVAVSSTAGGPSAFLSLRPADVTGRQSATAAAITTAAAPAAAFKTASRISAAVVTRTSSARAGGSRWVGPEMSVTAAPRRSGAGIQPMLRHSARPRR